MEKNLLTDPMVKPDEDVLETTLGKNYKVYQEFANTVSEMNLILEWNYYNDGKCWLCKILKKKKNNAWLSVWDKGFKLTFYFTEKNVDGVYNLDINSEIKETARENKPVGKLLPIILPIKNKKVMKDGIKILKYKMELK